VIVTTRRHKTRSSSFLAELRRFENSRNVEMRVRATDEETSIFRPSAPPALQTGPHLSLTSCINPYHLKLVTRAENKKTAWLYQAGDSLSKGPCDDESENLPKARAEVSRLPEMPGIVARRTLQVLVIKSRFCIAPLRILISTNANPYIHWLDGYHYDPFQVLRKGVRSVI
jgi:hypothetical protein